jgi:HK97 gp10 family phage protein
MAGIKVQITCDVKSFLKVVQETKEAAVKGFEEHMAKTAELVWTLAQQYVPVRTGRLRSSLSVLTLGSLQFKVGSNVEYAGYVEYGTRFMSPRPYLRPSIQQAKDTMDFSTLIRKMEAAWAT